jgi:hypothetical protein
VRRTRFATREIVAKPSGECSGLRRQATYGHIDFSRGSLWEHGAGTMIDTIAEFLLR